MAHLNCPRCGAELLEVKDSLVSGVEVATYACGTKWADAAPLQSDKCRIACLQITAADKDELIAKQARIIERLKAELANREASHS